MNRALMLGTAVTLALVGSATIGWWFGQQSTSPMAEPMAAPQQNGEQETPALANTTNPPPVAADGENQGRGKILYYRNPMGLPDVSPTPKKDSMGMDYIPVYENEAQSDDNIVRVSLAKVQKLGVVSEPAGFKSLTRTIRAVGTVKLDETGMSAVTTKVEGYIEKLYVNTTGQPVERGQALLEFYSPDLVLAQQEYLAAVRAVDRLKNADPATQKNAQQIADAALDRLRAWDISDGQIKRLRRDGKVQRTLTIMAPSSGQVMQKMVVNGMRAMPGEPLYEIADLSTVWVLADVFEKDLGLVQPGQQARITVTAYPDHVFNGTVQFIYPALSAETRTGRVRIALDNPEGKLKADMYATVELEAGVAADRALSVPLSAVLDSGTEQLVLVDLGEGRFEPRPVKVGQRSDGYAEINDGLKPGEKVVVSANFLIDAESNLQAALKAFVKDSGATQADTSDGVTP